MSIFTRAQVVAEARSWLRTPYHKNGRVKGVGVDCGTLLLCVFLAGGFLSEEDVRTFDRLCPPNQDWFVHSADEKYVALVIRHARHVLTAISYRTLEALPGSIAVTRHDHAAKRWNHGGIVTEWPRVIHAVGGHGVREVDATNDDMWNFREICIFDAWAKLEAAA